MLPFAAALTTLVLLVVAVLAIPVSLVVDIKGAARVRSRLRLRWLFGLVDVDLGGRQERGAPPGRPSTKVGQPQRSAFGSALPRRGRGPAIAVALVRTEGLVARILRLFYDLASRLSFRDFHLRVDVGLDDPADTGRLYGTLAPFFFAAESRGFDVRCRPDFREATLQGSCGGQIQARPISLVGVVVGFLGSPPLLRGIRAVWAARR